MSIQEDQTEPENWNQNPPIPIRTVVVKLAAPLPLVIILLPFVNFLSSRNIGWYLFSYTVLVIVTFLLIYRVAEVFRVNFKGLWTAEVPTTTDPDKPYIERYREIGRYFVFGDGDRVRSVSKRNRRQVFPHFVCSSLSFVFSISILLISAYLVIWLENIGELQTIVDFVRQIQNGSGNVVVSLLNRVGGLATVLIQTMYPPMSLENGVITGLVLILPSILIIPCILHLTAISEEYHLRLLAWVHSESTLLRGTEWLHLLILLGVYVGYFSI